MRRLLGYASVTAVRALELEGDALRVERQTEGGYDVFACPTPALVTVTAGATEPRYPSLKGIMQAKQKPLERLTAGDLGLTAEDLRSAQTVIEVVDAAAKGGGEIVQGETSGRSHRRAARRGEGDLRWGRPGSTPRWSAVTSTSPRRNS